MGRSTSTLPLVIARYRKVRARGNVTTTNGAMMTTIKIPNMYAIALDDSLTTPIEIHLTDKGATAVYDGSPDETYADLDALLDAHTVGADDLVNHLIEQGDDDGARAVAWASLFADDVHAVACHYCGYPCHGPYCTTQCAVSDCDEPDDIDPSDLAVSC